VIEPSLAYLQERSIGRRIPISLGLAGKAYSRRVAEETREETPGESLPPFLARYRRGRAAPTSRRNAAKYGAYLRTLLILEAAVFAVHRRRFVPPAIAGQDSRT
jgi:hypothetical protein